MHGGDVLPKLWGSDSSFRIRDEEYAPPLEQLAPALTRDATRRLQRCRTGDGENALFYFWVKLDFTSLCRKCLCGFPSESRCG